MSRKIMHGFAVSSGIAIGKASFAARRPPEASRRAILPEEIEEEVGRFRGAVRLVREDFVRALENLPPQLSGQEWVLESHLAICTDPTLARETERHIRQELKSAEWALEESLEAISGRFGRIPSPYIRERIQDVRMVTERLGAALAGRPKTHPCMFDGILLARDISLADAMDASFRRIGGFATEQGSRTAHTGILARNLGIPAVVGVVGLEEEANDGDMIIVDGLKGNILIEPSESELGHYTGIKEMYAQYEQKVARTASFPAETRDGLRIGVYANIEIPGEIPGAVSSGGEGVGLVRTELSVLARRFIPSEEELHREYAGMAAAMAPRRVVFRSFDIGADKLLGEQVPLSERNPVLGVRGIRYCLRHPNVFRRQLKAILRAGTAGNLAIMFPMVSDVSELRKARSILNEARQELEAASVAFARHIPVGVMIELPSAVLTAEELAAECDFFSIGTNDLTQYLLGADRTNRYVAHMQQPLHPAVIRALKHVCDMAHMAGISVSVCGEMASDPYCLPLLLGMPVDGLSVSPHILASVKHLIRLCEAEECRELLYRALSAKTTQTVIHMVRHMVFERFSEEMSFFTSQPETVP